MTDFREAVIDLGAVQANVAHLRNLIGTRHTMAVVKANGYGHGAVQVARAALAGGADWLGVADIDEALALRAAGIDAPLLAWLHGPDADFAAAINADIDLGLSSETQVRRAADAATAVGRTASVQIKLETGLNRNGVDESDWATVLGLSAAFERVGRLRVRGVFSHLANTSPRTTSPRSPASIGAWPPRPPPGSPSTSPTWRPPQLPYACPRPGTPWCGWASASMGSPRSPTRMLPRWASAPS
jgi:alanine racemase